MAKKVCTICGHAPANSPTGESCDLCYEFGGHENAHEDNNHKALREEQKNLETATAVQLREIAKGKVKNTGKDRMKSGELREKLYAYYAAEIDGCWICYPELAPQPKRKAKRSAPVTDRPSRKGQKIHVPLRAPGEVKAAVIAKAAGGQFGGILRVGQTVQIDVKVSGVEIHLAWDEAGRFLYDSAFLVAGGGKPKKIRNVAEALREIAKAIA